MTILLNKWFLAFGTHFLNPQWLNFRMTHFQIIQFSNILIFERAAKEELEEARFDIVFDFFYT